MRNILAPVAIFVLSGGLSLLAAQFAPLCFLISALIHIFVNRRRSREADATGDDDRDVLLIRSSYALMLPSFIFVAAILLSMSGVIFDRAGW